MAFIGKCVDCKHFHTTVKAHELIPDNPPGHCWRYPPKVNIVMLSANEAGPQWYSDRPSVSGKEWCGEFDKQ